MADSGTTRALVYLYTGRTAVAVPFRDLLGLEPAFRDRLTPADPNGHYHLYFYGVEPETLIAFSGLLSQFVEQYDFDYPKAMADLTAANKKKFYLADESRVPLLGFLLQEKFHGLAQALFRDTINDIGASWTRNSSERRDPSQARLLLDLVFEQPEGTFPPFSTGVLASYFFKTEPRPLRMPAEKWLELLSFFAAEGTNPLVNQSAVYFRVFASWLELSICDWRILRRRCSLPQLAWIDAHRQS